MKRKGFTLIELLAVIVILAIIALIAVPTVMNIINNAQKSAFKDSAYGIIKAGEMYYTNKMMDPDGMTEDKEFTFPDAIGLELKGSKPTNGIMTVTKEGKIGLAVHNGKYCVTKGFNTDEITISENVANCSFVVVYKETELNGADPVLKDGMIPITISNDGTATVADIYNEAQPWYKYGEKKWANVVTVTESSRTQYVENGTYNTGTTVDEEDILTYLTWIPRYKYKLWYTEATDTQPGVDGTKVHSIDIIFENKETAKSNGTTNGSYLTHPAFTFGSEKLNGIWVGKFETGYAGATSKSAAQVTTADSTKVIIKPNAYSWRNINVSNAYNTVKGMNTTNVYGLTSSSDTHMMKNTEWGAVAYLSHSSYGKGNSEVYINNHGNYWTGCGGDTADAGSDVICTNEYGTKTDGVYNQSTSGNITGVFDMSGGAMEYVMGYATTGSLSNSGFASLPEDKYVDKYSSTDSTQYSKRILGDATGEMGPFSSSYVGSWYNDYAFFASSDYPWFVRGGRYSGTSSAGVFSFGSGGGCAYSYLSFRVVLV